MTTNKTNHLLKDHGLKITHQRTQVLAVFLKKNRPLDLLTITKALNENFDRITLYRILNTFEEKGLIHKIPDKTGSPVFALCKHDSVHHNHSDNHVHFKCMNCQDVRCLEELVIPEIKIPEKFIAQKFSFLIEGICEKCNR